MRKNKNTLKLYASCAIIWTLTTVFSIITKLYIDSLFLFVMNTLCAILWIIAFITELKRNKSNRKV